MPGDAMGGGVDERLGGHAKGRTGCDERFEGYVGERPLRARVGRPIAIVASGCARAAAEFATLCAPDLMGAGHDADGRRCHAQAETAIASSRRKLAKPSAVFANDWRNVAKAWRFCR
jgi:hypothetical protein